MSESIASHRIASLHEKVAARKKSFRLCTVVVAQSIVGSRRSCGRALVARPHLLRLEKVCAKKTEIEAPPRRTNESRKVNFAPLRNKSFEEYNRAITVLLCVLLVHFNLSFSFGAALQCFHRLRKDFNFPECLASSETLTFFSCVLNNLCMFRFQDLQLDFHTQELSDFAALLNSHSM